MKGTSTNKYAKVQGSQYHILQNSLSQMENSKLHIEF